MPFRPLKASVNDGNFGDVLSGALTTTNNTATAVVSYAPPANSVVYLTATFSGRRTDGTSGDGCILTLTCAYKNVAGTLTQIGSDTAAQPYASASINASAASSGTSGSLVQLKVAGTSSTTINWVLQSAFTVVAQ